MEGTSKLTVTISDPNVNFYAYQIFKGDLAKVGTTETKTLSNVKWGASVSGYEDALLTALKADTMSDGSANPIKGIFANATDAQSVANALLTITSDSTQADAFAQIVGDVIVGKTGVVYREANSGKTPATNSDRYHAVFDKIADGYYFVEQASLSTDTDSTMNTYSRYMLKVAGPSTVDAKRSAKPQLDKWIAVIDDNGNEDDVRFADAAIGDEVEFRLDSTVPSMTGYSKYFFVVNDELSKGLTYVENSIDIVIAENDNTIKELVAHKDYDISTDANDDGTTSLKIVFKNFKQYDTTDYIGKDITIRYLATLNEDAVIGKTSDNYNKANLTYSNDPNYNYKGDKNDPDQPSDEEKKNGAVDSTTLSTVYVYTTGVNLIKVDSSTEERLEGAEFKIVGERLNTLVTKNYKYTPVGYESDGATAEGGNYYIHDDGAYNKVTLTDEIKADYKQDYVMYNLDGDTYEKSISGAYYHDLTAKNWVDEITDEIKDHTFEMDYIVYQSETDDSNTNVIESTDNIEYTGTVGTNGVLELNGLAAGTYTITEIVAPNGYNILKNDITLTIKFEMPKTGEIDKGCTWYYTVNFNDGNGNHDTVTGNSNGTYDLKIGNSAGSTLPSTGGIGTRIFYGVGSVLLIGAAVLLITKRRMSVEND
jgi:fimbrial isopeptide formation D2 family protein/LPXTG-motif cell wall-anchored protein